MTKIGYAAMMEQFHPNDLVEWCAQAEEAGFEGGVHGLRAFPSLDPRAGSEWIAWAFMGASDSALRCASGPPSRAPVSATTRP